MSLGRYFCSDLLAGRVAVGIGGGSSIGLAIATAFATVGAVVNLTVTAASLCRSDREGLP
jgi:NAD(P)-dependent dehydrogenase (short-subunit alcohol dehydrogenase family)